MNQKSTDKNYSIVLRKIFHRNATRIAMEFAVDNHLIKKAKSIGATWSKSLKCWHVPYETASYKAILKTFAGCEILIVQNKGLVIQNAPKNELKSLVKNISSNNSEELRKYVEMIVLKGYSASTLKTYKNEFSVYLQQLGNVNVQEMTPERLSSYFHYCHEQLNLSDNTVHSRLNAIKFYYEVLLQREKFFWQIPRPKKHLILPKVISEEKIIAGITTVENKKHKAIITIAYSAGLRVSEVINLKVKDIDSDRMQVFVANAKGKKDRLVTLSHYALKILRDYYLEYRPAVWLFEGQSKGDQYSTRSAQEIFRAIYKKIGIPDNMSFHSLRHSYATHLLENGTDIKYIQELLGHNDINTTLRYTHVSKKAIEKIESPLDKIVRKQGL